MIWKIITIILITFSVTACGSCLQAKTADIKNRLNAEIKIGDSRKTAENVLERVVNGSSYDEFVNRLTGLIRGEDSGCSPYEGIQIYVQLDGSGLVKNVEVFEISTSL